MKSKRYILSIITILIMCLCGCGTTNHSDNDKIDKLEKELKNDKEYANYYMEKLETSIQNQDAKILKDLFSNYVIENNNELNEQLDDFLVSFPNYNNMEIGSIQTNSSSAYAGKEYYIQPQIIIDANGVEYRVQMIICIKNEKMPKKVGIQYIGIINTKEIDDSFRWPTYDDNIMGVYSYY